MSLFDKIVAMHPELNVDDFHPLHGSILIQDDSDGQGTYIVKWDHPTIARPSDASLGITRKEIIEGEVIAEVQQLEAPTE